MYSNNIQNNKMGRKKIIIGVADSTRQLHCREEVIEPQLLPAPEPVEQIEPVHEPIE